MSLDCHNCGHIIDVGDELPDEAFTIEDGEVTSVYCPVCGEDYPEEDLIQFIRDVYRLI